MKQLVTAAQMRQIEHSAIAAGRVTGRELMERAGAGVVQVIDESWPDLSDRTNGDETLWAVVLCGPGNNGGDGFVIARLLQAQGWNVAVFLLGAPDRLPPDAAHMHALWSQSNPVHPLSTEALEAFAGQRSGDMRGVVIDAVFGTGLNRPVEADLARALSTARSLMPLSLLHYVCVDIQSGFCADSGRFLGEETLAVFGVDLTVTFHAAKCGHVLADAPSLSRTLRIVDIGLALDLGDLTEALMRSFEGLPTGLEAQAEAETTPATYRVDTLDALTDKGEGLDGWHKYDHGHAVVVSGGPGQGGAARLAARGALRIGAGLVTVACPLRAVPEHAAQLNAIMVRPIDGPSGLSELLEDNRVNALCLGPGLGLTQITADLVRVALHAQVPCVLDADALSRFEREPKALFKQLHDRAVLTPHMGEFRRLFPDLVRRMSGPAETGPAYSKCDAVREAAVRAGAVVLLKGPDTVIAHPDGRAAIHAAFYDRRAPWLATAGAGDVLAGFIAGLLARGFGPTEAAENAALLHVEAARAFGPGLIAEDLPEMLPQVFRAFAT